MYCLNPFCTHPSNPDNASYCGACGKPLNVPFYPFYEDRYQILQHLGQGGFGRTYKVRDTQNHNRLCVIKMLLNKREKEEEKDTEKAIRMLERERAIRMFERESEKLANLDHPQIPQQYARFEYQESYFIVQQYIEGEHLLTECFRRQKTFNEQEALELLQSLLPVLKYIHKKELVHRDIKPVNIMRRADTDMSPASRLVLIDFGIVKDLSKKIQSTMAFGTQGYAAIEHMRGQPEPASDIYSLGATCVYLMTGCFPDVPGRTIPFDKKMRLLWREELQQQGRTISEDFAQILDKMLYPLLEQRYESAEEVLRAIASLSPRSQAQQSTGLSQNTNSESAVEPTRHWMSLIKTVLVSPKNPDVQQSPNPVEASAPPTIPNLGVPKTFRFEVITVDNKGKINNRRSGQATYFVEELARGIDLEMVAIPGGTFMMGTDNQEIERLCKKYDWDGFKCESPQHKVTIKPFYMGKYAVTQAQWKAVAALPKVKLDLPPDPSQFKGANRPVENVGWWEAEEFCQRLLQKTGKQYRLASEAEWEYACRAGTTTPFHFGETITPELVNYDRNYPYGNAPKGKDRNQTVEVGSLPPNNFGLFEMHGNVWEWCSDHWHDNYQGAPNDGIICLTSNIDSTRLVRGGSWGINAGYCRSALRIGNNPYFASFDVGLRVVVSPRTL